MLSTTLHSSSKMLPILKQPQCVISFTLQPLLMFASNFAFQNWYYTCPKIAFTHYRAYFGANRKTSRDASTNQNIFPGYFSHYAIQRLSRSTRQRSRGQSITAYRCSKPHQFSQNFQLKPSLFLFRRRSAFPLAFSFGFCSRQPGRFTIT